MELTDVVLFMFSALAAFCQWAVFQVRGHREKMILVIQAEMVSLYFLLGYALLGVGVNQLYITGRSWPVDIYWFRIGMLFVGIVVAQFVHFLVKGVRKREKTNDPL